MEIRWVEDQPSLRPVREEMQKGSLIPDLVEIIKRHNLRNARASLEIEFPEGIYNVYECAVVRNTEEGSRVPYHVFIKQIGLRTNDAIGEILNI